MGGRGDNFFEAHIEKVVLAVAGLVCIWLLVTRVFISPNVVSYGNKKFHSSAIDRYIDKQADILKGKLDGRAEPMEPYKPRFSDFAGLIESAIKGVDVSVGLPQPCIGSVDIGVKRAYHVPRVGEVEDVQVGHIRAVAYVPTREIDEQNAYTMDISGPNDIDLVTVEGKFDVGELFARLHESFAGDDLEREWRDPCLAKPVFAAVQLERQELLADGSWSDWQFVPRTRIDSGKKKFEIIEDVENLPAGGMQVRLLQFKDSRVQMDLLQPEAYRIASAEQKWFPPSLHKKYVGYQKELELQKKRESLAAEKGKREKQREDRIRRQTQAATSSQAETSSSQGGKYGGGGGKYGGAGGLSTVDRYARKQQRRGTRDRRLEKERSERSDDESKQVSIADISAEFYKVLITEKTNFTEMDEPLLFWVHDDTAEAGKSYHYRIRLGVFNPIAGTNRFCEEDKALKDDVILWSKFSDTTETVKIPAALYIFPRQIQEAAKLVTVTISRYVLGYWYSKDFVARPGEVLGKIVEYEGQEKQEGILLPEKIDYSTGAVLVDAVAVNDWAGGRNMRARYYFDMLYSLDGSDIKHLPVDPRYWPEELQIKFNEIRQLEKEPKKPLQAWDSRLDRYKGTATKPGQLPGMPGETPPKYDKYRKYNK